jgi:hypothetical protein
MRKDPEEVEVRENNPAARFETYGKDAQEIEGERIWRYRKRSERCNRCRQ